MRTVYLDGAANTPLSPAALKAMQPYLSKTHMGNSMSIHSYGVSAAQAIERTRQNMSQLLRVQPTELFFTSGATESNNWAIMSTVMQWRAKHKKGGHIICSAMDHDSVLKCCQHVSKLFNIDLTIVYPDLQHRTDQDGWWNLSELDIEPHIRPDTILICMMDVNNELGTHNDIEGITKYAYTLGIPVLVDCTQSLSLGGYRIALGTRYPRATFMSFSAHKFYGPTGVGALIAKQPLLPLIVGGAQEGGLRGGTANTAGIVGMGAALAEVRKDDYLLHYINLTAYLNKLLEKELPQVFYNARRGISIISLNCSKVIHTEHLASVLDAYGIAVSAGSACDSEHDETAGVFNGSHVLLAIGLTEEEIRNTIRISYTRYTTKKDIKKLVKALKQIIAFQKKGASND